jgi:hypothetical protein
MTTSKMKIVKETQEYFQEIIQTALHKQQLKPSPEVEVYLMHLMTRFISSKVLFAQNQNGQLIDEPLTYLFFEALEAQNSILFQHLGDLSLYRGGFFAESLSRKTVSLDYYITMGQTSYNNAAQCASKKNLKFLFQELSLYFPKFIETLSIIKKDSF